MMTKNLPRISKYGWPSKGQNISCAPKFGLDLLPQFFEVESKLFDSFHTPIDFLAPVEIKKTNESTAISIDVPGIEKEKLSVDYKDGYLTITGERKQEIENDKYGAFISEKYYGQFSRTVFVGDVEKSEIMTSLKNGILKIEIPDKAKKIEVNNSTKIEIN